MDAPMFQRNYPNNPLLQPVKGVFIFKRDGDGYAESALELLKSMRCQIISVKDNRMTVSTSRGNLQTIKQCWLSKDTSDDLSNALNRQVDQIIIGGNLSN